MPRIRVNSQPLGKCPVATSVPKNDTASATSASDRQPCARPRSRWQNQWPILRMRHPLAASGRGCRSTGVCVQGVLQHIHILGCRLPAVNLPCRAQRHEIGVGAVVRRAPVSDGKAKKTMADQAFGRGDAALLAARVYALVRACPRGNVTTYGWLGAALGYPRGARMVGWIMNESPKGNDVPAHRRINRKSELAGPLAFRAPVPLR